MVANVFYLTYCVCLPIAYFLATPCVINSMLSLLASNNIVQKIRCLTMAKQPDSMVLCTRFSHLHIQRWQWLRHQSHTHSPHDMCRSLAAHQTPDLWWTPGLFAASLEECQDQSGFEKPVCWIWLIPGCLFQSLVGLGRQARAAVWNHPKRNLD